jgi:transposase
MDEWVTIRRRVLVEGVSKRQILREMGMHWTTLEKILEHGEPPGYRRRREPEKPKIGPYLEWVGEVLKADQALPRKRRHTARRIWERLRDERGFTGGYTIVKDAVRQLKRRQQEVFLPLVHRPGEAQVDFGQALVRMAGVLRKVFFFVMALPHSDAFFVMAFERECTESFWEKHVRAFAFFGGVPCRITYDNTTVAVSKIVGPHARRLTPPRHGSLFREPPTSRFRPLLPRAQSIRYRMRYGLDGPCKPLRPTRLSWTCPGSHRVRRLGCTRRRPTPPWNAPTKPLWWPAKPKRQASLPRGGPSIPPALDLRKDGCWERATLTRPMKPAGGAGASSALAASAALSPRPGPAPSSASPHSRRHF